MANIVGANLRRIRESRGISQTRLGGRADVNPATVNQIEMGGRNPSVATLERLAEVLQVPMADLFWEEVDSPKESAPSRSPSSDKPPEKRREYPYPWMADALARLIEHWKIVTTRPGDPSRLHAISVDALDLLKAVQDDDFPETERAERGQLASQILDIADDALEAYKTSQEAWASEVAKLEARREQARHRMQEIAELDRANEA